MAVVARRWPGHALPPIDRLPRWAPATPRIGATGDGMAGGVAAAEPVGGAGQGADGDGIAALALHPDVRRAPERAGDGLGVLVVQGVGVLGFEGLARAPP